MCIDRHNLTLIITGNKKTELSQQANIPVGSLSCAFAHLDFCHLPQFHFTGGIHAYILM